MTTPHDAAVKAATQLAKRAGCVQFEVRMSPIAAVSNWRAVATYPSGNQIEGIGTSPAFACDTLACRLLDGTVCRRCNHVIAVAGTDAIFCQWRREHDVWSPGCGLPLNRDIEMVPHG